MVEELVVSLQEALRTMDWTSGSSVEEPVGSYHFGIHFWRYSGPHLDRCPALGDVAAKDGFTLVCRSVSRLISPGQPVPGKDLGEELLSKMVESLRDKGILGPKLSEVQTKLSSFY